MSSLRSIATGLLAAGSLCLAASSADAASILHYDDYTGGTNSVAAALVQLGETATTTAHAGFTTALGSQSWDLVIVDISSLPIDSTNATAIVNHISGGGRVIMSYWNLDTQPALAAAFEASVAASYSTLQPVYDWTAHPIFGGVTSPVAFGPENLGDNGDELNATGGGAVIAGFVPAPTINQGAIVLGNGGRTILNGWSLDEVSGANGVNLVANEISFAVNPIPEPSSMALFGLGIAGLAVRRRRRAARS